MAVLFIFIKCCFMPSYHTCHTHRLAVTDASEGDEEDLDIENEEEWEKELMEEILDMEDEEEN